MVPGISGRGAVDGGLSEGGGLSERAGSGEREMGLPPNHHPQTLFFCFTFSVSIFSRKQLLTLSDKWTADIQHLPDSPKMLTRSPELLKHVFY